LAGRVDGRVEGIGGRGFDGVIATGRGAGVGGMLNVGCRGAGGGGT
jgi:hypothetical protein